MDTTMILIILALAGVVGFILGKSLWGPKNAMITAVVVALVALGGLWYYGYTDFTTIDEDQASIIGTTGKACEFDVTIYANGTANDIDNTTADATTGHTFTTPFKANTTGHTLRDTASTQTAGGSAFADPIYNFSCMPVATAGVTADDLVTIKFSCVDPGESISVSGTEYRLVAQDGNSDPYLYWKVVDASDGTVLTDWTPTSGSATFLYTDRVYVWLNVVYLDDGLSRIDAFDTQTLTATLSNTDGTWSESFTINAINVGTHA